MVRLMGIYCPRCRSQAFEVEFEDITCLRCGWQGTYDASVEEGDRRGQRGKREVPFRGEERQRINNRGHLARGA